MRREDNGDKGSMDAKRSLEGWASLLSSEACIPWSPGYPEPPKRYLYSPGWLPLLPNSTSFLLNCRSIKEVQSLLNLPQKHHFRSVRCLRHSGLWPTHPLNDAQNGKAKTNVGWPFELCFLKDEISKNRPAQGRRRSEGEANFFSLCNGKQSLRRVVSDVAEQGLVSNFSWCVKCIPYVNHGLKIFLCSGFGESISFYDALLASHNFWFQKKPWVFFKDVCILCIFKTSSSSKSFPSIVRFLFFSIFFNLPTFFVLSLSLFFLAFLYIMLMTSKLTHKLKPDL